MRCVILVVLEIMELSSTRIAWEPAPSCHSRESGNPFALWLSWTPAFAGVTEKGPLAARFVGRTTDSPTGAASAAALVLFSVTGNAGGSLTRRCRG